MSQCPSCRARSECLRDGIPVPFDIMASHRHIYSSSPWQSSPHWPRCQAAAAQHLGTHHGCADLMTFAVSAAVFEAHVLPYPHLAGRYMQLLADVFADAVHHALTVRAAFLCVGKIVFN